MLTQLAQKFSVARKGRKVRVSTEFGGKQSHETGPIHELDVNRKWLILCFKCIEFSKTLLPFKFCVEMKP